MTNSSKLITNKQPLPNVRFWDDEKVGNNIFFIPESLNTSDSEESLVKFIDTQIKGYYQQITIPGIISNFLGKKLANQKYYLKMKKELPNFIYNRVPGKQLNDERTNIFDFSGIVSDILSVSKSRSQKQVFNELNKLIGSVIKDYPSERKNYLFIRGDNNINGESSDFLNFIIYINRINSGKIKTDLDGIIYKLDNKYYPIAIPHEDGIIFLKNIISQILQKKKHLSKGIKKDIDLEEDFSEEISAREEISALIKNKDVSTDDQKAIKKIVHKLDLVGTFQEKLETLFKDDLSISNNVKNLTSEINKKYNGTVSVNIPKDGVFDNQKIVGMDELGNYDKQRTELTENIDELVEDLIHGTLEKDPDLNISVKNIKTKIVDDNKNRYKEYQVKIQHKDFGATTNKPYTISFRVPVPVQGKYIKLGGNNYILINQLFPKPIQKIAPNLIRFYTHYSVAALSIKNTKLSASNGFIEIEDLFVQQLKSINAIKLTNFDNKVKDKLTDDYGLDDLRDFKYKRMEIKA